MKLGISTIFVHAPRFSWNTIQDTILRWNEVLVSSPQARQTVLILSS
jgi:hypothetical protein